MNNLENFWGVLIFIMLRVFYIFLILYELILGSWFTFARAYVQFRGSEFHTMNERFWQSQEQRRAKAQR